jgi:Domain of unknown function (DUF6438)
MIKNSLLCMLVALLAGCQSNRNTKVVNDPSPLISLRTGGCRGYCPMFVLEFKQNGQVDYEGIRSVEREGKSSFQLTDSELKSLRTTIESVNLWQYPERFPTTIADAPGATLTIFRAGQSKEITGGPERPQPIRNLDDQLRALATVHGYNLKSFNPEATKPSAELLVRLKPDINAGNWLPALNEKSKADLRLIRRASSENVWVVSFNPTIHQATDLIDLLKAQPEVLEAQLNRAVEERNKN